MSEVVIGHRSFGSLPRESIVAIHDPITPAEVYKGQPITASLKIVSTGEVIGNLSVFRLSPLGAEIDISDFEKAPLEPGTEVDLEIVVAKQTCAFYGISVNSVHQESGRKLVGIRWFQKPSALETAEEKRQKTRWLCGDYFLPSGVAPNPAKFNEFVYFTVVDVSSSGMQLSTSLRNKLLIPGMVLESVVSFPLVGQLTIHFKITNARLRSIHGKEFLSLGVQLTDTAPHILETVGQYLLQFGPQLSASTLKEQGFLVKSIESAVNFSFVKTVEDYRDVLNLRKMAYGQVGKFDKELPSEEMSDIFDAKSRILIARHKGEVVGSLRITFHSPDEPNEYEQFVKLPPHFPRRDEVVVVSRVCTHPHYRGADLMYGLIRQCVLAVLQSRRRYMLGGGMEKLVPIYEKLGFKRQGVFFQHGSLNGVKEEILLADVTNILLGADVSPGVWNELFSDLTNYITHLYELPFSPSRNLRLSIYRSLGPITRLFTGRHRNPKKKK